jgi:hypothetical protein
MHRRRGGEARKRGTVLGVSRPIPAGIRAPPPGSGVVPFSSRSRQAPNQSVNDFSGHLALACLNPFQSDSGPYVSGTMGTDEQGNRAYGISCRTRPIPTPETRLRSLRNRYRMGRLTHRSSESSFVTNVTISPTKKDVIHDGLGLKSGLILGQPIATWIPLKPQSEQSDSPVSINRICAPGNGSPVPLYKPASAVTSRAHPMGTTNLVNPVFPEPA